MGIMYLAVGGLQIGHEKKNENQPMADEEIPKGFSNSSLDDSPSTPQCLPGARDFEQSAVIIGKALTD